MSETSAVTDLLPEPCLSPAHVWNEFPARMFVFDLDDTLAPSKSPLPSSMSDLISGLLERAEVCIISGGRFEQFDSQVIRLLTASEELLPKLHLMPTCGTRYYRWNGGRWAQLYAEDLTVSEKKEVTAVLTESAVGLGLWAAKTWGPIVEDRGSQITFSALGQNAPVSAKVGWDPDGSKRTSLRALAASRLPDLEVRIGGSTSIDVTRKGIDKAYGVAKLMAHTGLSSKDLLFIGDRLDVDGNDYPVRRLGIRCVAVSSWEQTAALLDRIVRLREAA